MTLPEIVPSPEIPKASINVVLVHMVGEGRIDLQEPIGLEVLATNLLEKVPGSSVHLLDTQADAVSCGRVNIKRIVEEICKKGVDPTIPLLIGISVPIYAWENTKSLAYRLRKKPPASPYVIVIGNSIATYVQSEILQRELPEIVIVKGEGEDHLVNIAHRLIAGKDIPKVFEPTLVDLNKYLVPNRPLAVGIFAKGGEIRLETSRGCDYGGCTFCSRCFAPGKDYRTIPAITVIKDLARINQFQGLRSIGLTDEAAFSDLEKTRQFIEVFKASGLEPIPMHVSMRNDTVLKLEEAGLLPELIGIGLSVLFLGSEGGSDSYLDMIGKRSKLSVVRRSLEVLKKYPVKVEQGFITFHWRQDMNQLQQNILFLEEDDHYKDVSDPMNYLHVRAGSTEEKIMRAKAKYGEINYHPDDNFSVNRAEYIGIPFLHPDIEKVFNKARKYYEEKRPLFYSVRALIRSCSLPPKQEAQLVKISNAMKLLDVKYLKHLIKLEEVNENMIKDKHQALAQACLDLLGSKITGNIKDMVIREAEIFLDEEKLRKLNQKKSEQIGAFLVLRRGDHVLIIREINEDEWGFPGGEVNSDEPLEKAAIREAQEEIGVNATYINLGRKLYVHCNTPLTLHFYESKLDDLSNVNLNKADYEVADALWVRIEDLNKGIFKMKENLGPVIKKLLGQ